MGFLKNIFSGHQEKEVVTEKNTLYSPVAGTVIELEDVADGVFSSGMLGKGCAVLPSEGMVVAPCNGTITTVTDTKHAIGLTSDDGMEVLIHIGLDTVTMNGKGFQVFVKAGQQIKCGQELISFDRQAIADAGFKDTTMVVIANSDNYNEVNLIKKGMADAGEKLITVN